MNTSTSRFQLVGHGCELEVFDDRLTLKPRGLLGVINRGLKGQKTIPFASITALQHKAVGLTTGYLQFSLKGGNESTGGVMAAQSDENTFVYAKRRDNDRVLEIKAFIEKRLLASAQPVASASVADELIRLGDLHSKGVLSEAEFQAAKRRILGMP